MSDLVHTPSNTSHNPTTHADIQANVNRNKRVKHAVKHKKKQHVKLSHMQRMSNNQKYYNWADRVAKENLAKIAAAVAERAALGIVWQ